MEIPCNVYKGDSGRVSGPPEHCYPPEPAEYDGPEECDTCGEKIDDDEVIEKALEEAADNYREPSDDLEDNI